MEPRRDGDGAGDGRPADPRAFEEIVARFRGPLTAYAHALLRDRGHAEDAVQEAFLHAYRNLHRLRDPRSLRPWLYAILENRALSAWRHGRRRPAHLLGDGHAVADGTPWIPGEPEAPAAPPATGGEAVRRQVRAALAELPAGYRDALALHYIEGHSARQVARSLGLTVNNAKVRLFRARNALRRELRARGVGGPAAGAHGAGVRP
jgi:RNA polymerase sigma-70 factor (ECF subfamily)